MKVQSQPAVPVKSEPKSPATGVNRVVSKPALVPGTQPSVDTFEPASAPAPVATAAANQPKPGQRGFWGGLVDSFQEKTVSALDTVTGGRISGARDVRGELETAMADGRISQDEASELMANAREKGLSSGETEALTDHFRANVDRYDPDAQRSIDGAVGGVLSRPELDDPAPMSHRPVSSAPAYGRLFGAGISPDDVHQGAAGDCFLLAPLAAIAQQQPEAIRDMIQPNADGTVTVSFYADDRSRVQVTVDRDLPGGGREYARAHGNKLWVALVEKAYAQLRGQSYDAIGGGGYPDEAIWAITGRNSAYEHFEAKAADEIYELYRSTLADGRVATASTGEDVSGRYTKEGFVPTHAYTVLGVHEKNGQKFVELRNPIATIEHGSDGAIDGRFSVPLELFAEKFVGGYFQK